MTPIPEDLLVVIAIAAGVAMAELLRWLDVRTAEFLDRMACVGRYVVGVDEKR
jgi:hypothetical protein